MVEIMKHPGISGNSQRPGYGLVMTFAYDNTDNHQDELGEFKRVQNGMKHIADACRSSETVPPLFIIVILVALFSSRLCRLWSPVSKLYGKEIAPLVPCVLQTPNLSYLPSVPTPSVSRNKRILSY